MNQLLKFEEAAQWAFSIFLFSQLPYAWWWYPALILLPDLSMIGYASNTRVGAAMYNLFHHKALGVALGVLGSSVGSPALMLAGVILFGHSAMDRMLGYGLKYNDSFKHTHLGMIGK
ncbi:DUF4260 domain-containing protein [Telluribacter sp. SYSU D00476]|uniref:DUF4260 domain-containing protein n=1 Tax=Telluribacter sp. SYSU D00476 TaxID=2811430 RepID=UPI001FF65DA2|nr:DUF4260 domain-containing protein [Telluribacter sp. SYSU D00476]